MSSSNLISGSALAGIIAGALQGMTWAPTNGSPEPMFGSIHRFGATDFDRIFRWILAADPRVAVVIVSGEQWETTYQRPRLLSQRTVEISVIVSDRVIGDQDAAIWGSDLNPGVDRIKNQVIEALSSTAWTHAEALGGVVVTPKSATLVYIEDEGKHRPGRAAYTIEFSALVGLISTNTGP